MNVRILRTVFTAALMSIHGLLWSQEQMAVRERADELYGQFEYARAAVLYHRLSDAANAPLIYWERLADCYMKMQDYEAAENWYQRIVGRDDSKPEHRLLYGDALMLSAGYAAAKQQFESYAALTGRREPVALRLAGCDSALRWMAAPGPYLLRNEQEVNTPLSEFAVLPGEGRVYFAAELDEGGGRIYGRTGNTFLRIKQAQRVAGTRLKHPSPADTGAFNSSSYHVGPLASDRKGETFFVTRTYAGNRGGKTRDGKRTYRDNRLELCLYTRQGGGWEVTPFPHNNVKAYSVGHAALGPEENILYFISDMPGGLGGTDIWYCEKLPDGSWGTPVNAGNAINSRGNEMFPNFGADGLLYYASDGFPGMGGLDIFRTRGQRTSWTVPENLKYPVNSAADDFAFLLVDGGEAQQASGYLSSNRKGGAGGDDIYSFTTNRPGIDIVLRGTVSDKKTLQRLDRAQLTLYNADQGEIIARKPGDADGTFVFSLSAGRNYTVRGAREGYHEASAAVSTIGITRSDTLEVALLLDPVFAPGQQFVLEDIYYDFDRHAIRPDAALILDQLVRTLHDNPALKIELSSHTDSRGGNGYNMQLSDRRARAAADYITGRGIAKDRIVARGYGETKLVNRCVDGVPCSREEHQANRRTEVTVLEYGIR